MKPDISQLHMSLVTTLATRILPELPADSYATGDARMAAVIALLLAQETDRAADTLARENREMRALFLTAADLGLDPALCERLRRNAATGDADLKISTLSEAHAVLADTLIALHEVVEASGEGWARHVNKDIWAMLLRGAEDRLLIMPTM